MFTGKANTFKRLSKACRIVGELPRSMALAEESLGICQKAFKRALALHNREVSVPPLKVSHKVRELRSIENESA